MKQFSKLKPKNEFADDDKEKVLYTDDHVKIVQFEDWSIIKQKDAVCCIPYLIETNQIILRHEYIPTFKYIDGQEYHITLICGGIEIGETPEMALLRELEEEAGIVLREDYVLEDMKTVFAGKSQANKFYPYILPLNEKDYHEVASLGDGSKVEAMSKSVKIDIKYLGSINSSDLITAYMLMKIKEYLNL